MKKIVRTIARNGITLLTAAGLVIGCVPGTVHAAQEPASSETAQAEQVKTFSDVNQDSWFYPFVSELSGQGVISGYPDGTFRPQRNVTVGETLSLVLMAAGFDKQESTGEHWSSGFADFAVQNDYLPSALREDLNAEMTRLDVAQLAAKALKLLPAKGESAFADTDDGYVNVLFEKKVLAGSIEHDVRVFKPDDPISRAEISAIVWNMRNTDVHAGQIETEYYYVDILEGVPVSSYNPENFRQLENGRVDYIAPGVQTKTGVDVASFQGDIDWERVKMDGIDFAIIRVGGRGYSVGQIYDDKNFEANLQGALDAGLEVGAYFFSQAINEEEAQEEAEFVLEKLAPYQSRITFPVVFDWEYLGDTSHRSYNMDPDVLGRCANLFGEMMYSAGYNTMIYFNRYGGYRSYDLTQVLDHQFWFAQYLSTTDHPTFYYDFAMWQYTSEGRVEGINAPVDMNLYFVKEEDGQKPETPQQTQQPEKPEEPQQPQQPAPEDRIPIAFH